MTTSHSRVGLNRWFFVAWCLGLAAAIACGDDAASGTKSTSDAGADGATTVVIETPGPTEDAARPEGSVCTDCIEGSVTWQLTGGLKFSQDVSKLSACRAYVLTRALGGGDPTAVCTTNVAVCGGAPITAGDVDHALKAPEVVSAFAQATEPVFGCDPRPNDGAVLEVTLNGKTIAIGSEPAGSTDPCNALPDSLRHLRAVLLTLDDQESDDLACKPDGS